MVSATISNRQIQGLNNALKGTNKNIRSELAIAVNATTKKTKTAINKQVRSELAVTAKSVNRGLAVSRKADRKSKQPTGEVTLSKTARLPLKDFKPRQTKKGVSYKISKTQGRSTVSGAFMGPKPGVMKASWKGNVFKRVGQSKLPIVKLQGPSPWGAFVKKGMARTVKKESKRELDKQIKRRIRFVKLKKSGSI